MIIVDTSVWVDLFQQNDTSQSKRCVELIEEGALVGLTDIIFTEILQGIRTEREASLVERRLRLFPILRLKSLEDFRLAADLYRQARRSGITIRKTLDCLIAAVCIRSGASLLHSDRDFDLLASCSNLQIFSDSFEF